MVSKNIITISKYVKISGFGGAGYKNVLKISHGNGTFDIQYCAIYIKDMQDSTL